MAGILWIPYSFTRSLSVWKLTTSTSSLSVSSPSSFASWTTCSQYSQGLSPGRCTGPWVKTTSLTGRTRASNISRITARSFSLINMSMHPFPKARSLRLAPPLPYTGVRSRRCMFSYTLDMLLKLGGINTEGTRAPVRNETHFPKLGKEACHLLPGGADAACHLFVGGAIVNDHAAVGLFLAFLGKAQEQKPKARPDLGEGQLGHLLLEGADPLAKELQKGQGAVARRCQLEQLGYTQVHDDRVLDHHRPLVALVLVAEAKLPEQFPGTEDPGHELSSFRGEDARAHPTFPD